MRRRKEINPAFLANQSSSKQDSNAITTSSKQESNHHQSAPNASNNILNTLKRARASGVLNLSNANLQHFAHEICEYNTIPIDESENFWEILPLTKIDLSYNKITSIPEDIGLLKDLVCLKIRDNHVSSIPANIRQCKLLTCVDMTSNKIEDLGDCIGDLVELRELYLSMNQLKSISPAINACQMIHSLEVHSNQLRSIPDLHGFEYLHKLNLSNNILERLPMSITAMTTITTLELQKNRLSMLPDLSSLCKLSTLDVSENMLVDFPILPKHGCLDRLYLSNNMLMSIDMRSLSHVKESLTELLLHDNKISIIPAEVGLLDKLIILHVGNNDLTDLPVSLGYASSLSKLLVDGNPIRSIRRTLLTMHATNELKAYLRTRGPPIEGQAEISAIPSRTGSLPSSSTTNIAVKASSLSSIEVFFEDKVRNINSGSLDLSKQPLIFQSSDGPNSSMSWAIILYRTLMKFSPVTFEMSMSTPASYRQSSSSKLVSSIADIGGIEATSVSFTPIMIAKLDLSYNNLKTIWYPCDIDQGLTLLCSNIGGESALKNLQWLNLSNNSLSIDLSHASSMIEDRAEVLLLPYTLSYLDLSYNRLNDSNVYWLIRGLANLSELHLSGNVLQDIPVTNDHPNLRILRLSQNRISSLQNFSLSSYRKLEVFDLRDNQIQEIQGFVLDAVHQHATSCLTTLLLANNAIREIPAELCMFDKMISLTLHGNPQKMIRTNQLDHIDMIFTNLRNKLLPASATLSKAESITRTTSSSSPSPASPSRGLVAQSSVRSFEQLEHDIDELEKQLQDNVGVTASKRSQLQKTLALKRANYNRLKQ